MYAGLCLAGRDAALLSLCLSRRAGQLFLRLDGLALAAVRSAGFCGGALGKAAILYGSSYLLFACIAFPPAVRHMLLFAMSWPQIVTGIIGAVLGMEVSRLLGHQPE